VQRLSRWGIGREARRRSERQQNWQHSMHGQPRFRLAALVTRYLRRACMRSSGASPRGRVLIYIKKESLFRRNLFARPNPEGPTTGRATGEPRMRQILLVQICAWVP